MTDLAVTTISAGLIYDKQPRNVLLSCSLLSGSITRQLFARFAH
jgi:hypothetical protein